MGTSPRRKPGAAPRRSPTDRRQEIRRRARGVYRDAILEAAEAVFAERGFLGTRVTDVARAAGLGAATLYNYFPSKDDLFRELIEHRFMELLGQMRRISDEERDPRRCLERLVHGVFHFLEQHRPIYAVFAEIGGASPAHVRQICGPKVERCHDEAQALWATVVARAAEGGLVRRDVAPLDLVAFLTGAMMSLSQTWILEGQSTGLAERTPLVLDLFLNGASPR